MSQFSCSVAMHCTNVLLCVMYQLDTPIVRSVFSLNSCVSNVKRHLRELQTTQSCVASKRDLILARVGLCDEER